MKTFHARAGIGGVASPTRSAGATSANSQRETPDVPRQKSKRFYVVLFRGKALRQSAGGSYTPRSATRKAGSGAWPAGPGASTYRSIGECNGLINADLESRRSIDNTVGVDDYTIIALEVKS